MLLAGSNIQSQTDVLKPISVEHLHKSLISPKPDIESRIRQLRIIRQVDDKLYARSKKLLPFFVCGMFNPAIRRSENFAYTSYFVVDLDNLSEKQIDLSTLRSKVEADPRVMLSFVSPSEDGLKLLFRLKERCYDAGLYKLFYQEFVRKFSVQYHLEQVIDARTCDVSRACFISIDPLAYYNQDAEPVDINDFLKTDDSTSMFDLKHEQDQIEKEQSRQQKEEKPSGPAEPEEDELAHIKELLQMQRKRAPELRLPIYVPERLEQIIEGLRTFVEDQGMTIYDVQNIQYGKKIRGRLGNRLAEVNLFYGKKGFRIVQTIKGILSPELNDILAELIEIYLRINT